MRNIFIAAVAAFGLSASASAAVVEFKNVTATWTDVVMGGNLRAPTFTGNGTDNALLTFGYPVFPDLPSGYRLDATQHNLSLEVNPPSGTASTDLATFTHYNYRIYQTSEILSVKLHLTADIVIDGEDYDTLNFYYDFIHDETLNAIDPCKYGGANFQGVNINRCADRVSVNFNRRSDAFQIGNEYYTLDIVGFLQDDVQTRHFLTIEERDNSAVLQARLTLYTDAVAGIPEPATWGMMVLGFGAVGFAARRRRPMLAEA